MGAVVLRAVPQRMMGWPPQAEPDRPRHGAMAGHGRPLMALGALAMAAIAGRPAGASAHGSLPMDGRQGQSGMQGAPNPGEAS